MRKRFVVLLVLAALVAATAFAGGGKQAASGGGSGTAPITFTIFANHSWYNVNHYTGIIPEEITRLTGVTLEPRIAIDEQQLGTMIASGALPDLVYTSELLDQMSHPDVSYCLEDLIKQYNINWQISPKRLTIARLKAEDNKAYTILNHYSEKSDWANTQAVPMLASLLYRKDIYTAAGSPPVRTLDDLFNLYTRVKAANPNMTMLQLNSNWNVAFFKAQVGMPQDYYIEQPGGTYIYYLRDPRYKQVLNFLNRCWRAGFISPDDSYFVAGSEVPAAGNYFSTSWCTQDGIINRQAEHTSINPGYILAEMVPLNGAAYITSSVGWSATFITKNNKNPERAARFLQFMFSEEGQRLSQMGRAGIDYTMSSSGMPVFSAQWKAAIADGSHNRIFNPWWYLGGSPIVESLSRIATTDPALVADTYKYMRENYDNFPWVPAALPIGETPAKIANDRLNELLRTYERRIIMAGSEAQFEALFQEALANANQSGLATAEQFMITNIRKVKPMFQ